MKSVKVNQQVIVRTIDSTSVLIGRVLDSRKLKGRKYYTIELENGRVCDLVPLNKPGSAIYIDGDLTSKYFANAGQRN